MQAIGCGIVATGGPCGLAVSFQEGNSERKCNLVMRQKNIHTSVSTKDKDLSVLYSNLELHQKKVVEPS